MKRTKTEKQLIAIATPETTRLKSKLYIFSLQSEDGTIQRLFTGDNYDQLWLQATTESKAMGGFWSAHDIHGRFIDGNYRSKIEK